MRPVDVCRRRARRKERLELGDAVERGLELAVLRPPLRALAPHGHVSPPIGPVTSVQIPVFYTYRNSAARRCTPAPVARARLTPSPAVPPRHTHHTVVVHIHSSVFRAAALVVLLASLMTWAGHGTISFPSGVLDAKTTTAHFLAQRSPRREDYENGSFRCPA